MARFPRPAGWSGPADADGPDDGSIVIGWLTRIAVLIGVAGLALFDAISIGTTAMSVSDNGSFAAHEASATWLQTKSIQKAYDTAVEVATEQNAANVVATQDFTVDPDGTVHLTVSRDATTLVVFRIGAIKKWAHVERQARGKSVE